MSIEYENGVYGTPGRNVEIMMLHLLFMNSFTRSLNAIDVDRQVYAFTTDPWLNNEQ